MINDLRQLRPLLISNVKFEDGAVELLAQNDRFQVTVLTMAEAERREDAPQRVEAGTVSPEVRKTRSCILPYRLVSAEHPVELVLHRIGAPVLRPRLIQPARHERLALRRQKEQVREIVARWIWSFRPALPHRLHRLRPQRDDARDQRLASLGVYALTLPVDMLIFKVGKVGGPEAAVQHQHRLRVQMDVIELRGGNDLPNVLWWPVGNTLLLARLPLGHPLFLLARSVEFAAIEGSCHVTARVAAPHEERPQMGNEFFGGDDAASHRGSTQWLEEHSRSIEFRKVGEFAIESDDHLASFEVLRIKEKVRDLLPIAGSLAITNFPIGVLAIQMGHKQVHGLPGGHLGNRLFDRIAPLPADLLCSLPLNRHIGTDLAEVGAVQVAGEFAAPSAAGMPRQAVLGLHPLAVRVRGSVRRSVTAHVTRFAHEVKNQRFCRENQEMRAKKSRPGQSLVRICRKSHKAHKHLKLQAVAENRLHEQSPTKPVEHYHTEAKHGVTAGVTRECFVETGVAPWL